jgi:hypothetical protein
VGLRGRLGCRAWGKGAQAIESGKNPYSPNYR